MDRAARAPKGAVLLLLVLGAVGFLPLFAGPGYEAALAAGLVTPAFASVSAALYGVRAREQPFRRLCRGLAYGAGYAAIAALVALLHGIRAGFCDARAGWLLFFLGPGPGACLGGAWGVAAGSLAAHMNVRRVRTLAVFGALFGPVGSALVSVGRFYTSPIVFAFDPFAGFFSGPVYETIIDGTERLASYRVGSLFTLLGAGFVALSLRARRGGRLGLRRPLWAGLGLALLCFSGSGALAYFGPELGHYQTAGSIRDALGRTLASTRCTLVYARSIHLRDAELVLRECDAHLRELEAFFEIEGTPPVTVFLFESATQKGKLIGAARTFLAKPWRHEVYVQAEGFPHPVLGHELAHVVAGSFAPGPFRVAGAAGGWLPDPGRIEGFAVAASPRLDSDLDLESWAAALYRLDLLPELETVFQLGFLAAHSRTAYTTAGAFVEWLRTVYGAERIRRWYAGETLAELTGKDLSELERNWRAELSELQLSASALEAARGRFDQPGLFARRCPHEIDELEARAYQHLYAGDAARAKELFEAILGLEQNHVDALLGRARCRRLLGASELAKRELEALSLNQALHRADRGRATEALGDLAFENGDLGAARKLYARVAESVIDDDHLRTLDVKSGVSSDGAVRALLSLLIGRGGGQPDFDVAGPELAAWATESGEALPRYLLGRNLYLRGHWDEAARYLDAALGRRLDLPRVEREARVLRFTLACARGEAEVAARVFSELEQDAELGSGRRQGLERFYARCGFVSGAR